MWTLTLVILFPLMWGSVPGETSWRTPPAVQQGLEVTESTFMRPALRNLLIVTPAEEPIRKIAEDCALNALHRVRFQPIASAIPTEEEHVSHRLCGARVFDLTR